MWTLKLMFAGLLQEALTFGIGALVILGLLAVAYFVPSLRLKRLALSLAAAVAVGLFAYGIGVQHEFDRQRAKERVLKEQADVVRQRVDELFPIPPDLEYVPPPLPEPVPDKRGRVHRVPCKPADTYDRACR